MYELNTKDIASSYNYSMALHLLWRSLAAVVVVTSQFTRSVSTETFLLPDYDENNLAVGEHSNGQVLKS